MFRNTGVFILSFIFLKFVAVHSSIAISRPNRRFQHFVWHAESVCDIKCTALSRFPDHHLVYRAQRFLVEGHSRVDDIRCLLRIFFYLGIMRRDKEQTFAFSQFLEYRDSDPHALRGICPGAHLVHDHETVPVYLSQDLQHVFDMCRECREIFGDVLPVPDVAQISAVHADIRSCAGDVKPALRHDAAEHDCLDRHRLSAGIGAGYDDASRLLSDFKLQGDVYFLVHQRMPCVCQGDPALCVDLRFHGVHVDAEFALRKYKIQFFHHADIFAHRTDGFCDHCRQRVQDAVDLVFLTDAQQLQLLAIFCDAHRLDEKSISGGRFIDHTAWYLELVFFFYRNAYSSISCGAIAVRHALFVGAHDLFRLLLHLLFAPHDIASDLP